MDVTLAGHGKKRARVASWNTYGKEAWETDMNRILDQRRHPLQKSALYANALALFGNISGAQDVVVRMQEKTAAGCCGPKGGKGCKGGPKGPKGTKMSKNFNFTTKRMKCAGGLDPALAAASAATPGPAGAAAAGAMPGTGSMMSPEPVPGADDPFGAAPGTPGTSVGPGAPGSPGGLGGPKPGIDWGGMASGAWDKAKELGSGALDLGRQGLEGWNNMTEGMPWLRYGAPLAAGGLGAAGLYSLLHGRHNHKDKEAAAYYPGLAKVAAELNS